MGLREQLIGFIDRIQARGIRASERANRNRPAVDAMLAWSLARAEAAGTVHFPVQYLQFLRDCTEVTWATWTPIRDDAGPKDAASKRFAALVDSLDDLPAVEFTSAERLARTADRLRANVNPATGLREHGDRQRRFARSASLGCKGRILYTTVKVMQSSRVIELGTYVGMSAMFLLEALETAGPDAHVTTVELQEEFHSLASALLAREFNGRVTCIKGSTDEVVPELSRTLRGVDLLFHDARHSGEAYVRDFLAAEAAMAPGSVVLFDDIRWNNPLYTSVDPKCHEGWMEVTRHPRVRCAGEINGAIGALLLH